MLPILFLLGSLLMQIPTNCVFEFTCMPENPLQVFEIYNHVYGVPNIVILGLIVGVINAAIYARSRSLTVLAIVGIYSITAIGATSWASVGETFELIKLIIAFAVGSAVLILVLKVLRE
jgi:hypothetical protein